MARAKRFLAITVLIACVVFFGPAVVEACPTCKNGVSENSSNLVRGFGWSIMFMMSMPFLILGGLSTYFYIEIRRARRQLSQRDGQADLNIGQVPSAN